MALSSLELPAPRPWWREGYVWLIIAGPVAVILAGIVTTVLAVQGSDRLLAEDYYQRGLALSRAAQPAMAARNGVPVAGERPPGRPAATPSQP